MSTRARQPPGCRTLTLPQTETEQRQNRDRTETRNRYRHPGTDAGVPHPDADTQKQIQTPRHRHGDRDRHRHRQRHGRSQATPTTFRTLRLCAPCSLFLYARRAHQLRARGRGGRWQAGGQRPASSCPGGVRGGEGEEAKGGGRRGFDSNIFDSIRIHSIRLNIFDSIRIHSIRFASIRQEPVNAREGNVALMLLNATSPTNVHPSGRSLLTRVKVMWLSCYSTLHHLLVFIHQAGAC
jgi:hypothetical protein